MPSHSHQVLIVEDDRDTREAFAMFLAFDSDITVRSAASVDEALAVIAGGFTPCVALVDYRLPDALGTVVIASLHAAAPSAAVILLTGDTDAAARASDLGAHGVLRKPIVPTALREVIVRHCESSAGGGASGGSD